MTTAPRYNGKPLLRLLECYVLWAIEHISEEELKALKEMTPKLQQIYKVQGDWQQVISEAVQLPENLPDLIRGLWHKNSEIVRKAGTTLTAQQFAEMFVDQNLLH